MQNPKSIGLMPKLEFGDADWLAIRAALERPMSGDGPIGQAVEKGLRDLCGVRHALLTTSCTHALEMAMMVLDIGPNDEVLLPSFTFTSTANVIMRQGAIPVFVDIDPLTFNMDPRALEAAITPRARCVIPVHYAGQSCDMDAIMDIASRHRLHVVEDAAQGIGATWRGRHLGTIGDIGCLSFHATKNVSCGEGGAFLTSSKELAERAEIIREKGTNRRAFLRGDVARYEWMGLGSSYVLSDLLAAVLASQLPLTQSYTTRRLSIWDRYYSETAQLESDGHLQRPKRVDHGEGNGHIFPILVNDTQRPRILSELASRGVNAAFHYQPLHASPYMRAAGLSPAGELPVTDHVASSIVRLPISHHLTDADVTHVLNCLSDVLCYVDH